ncbi:hypothetical protein AgCh_026471 [Apium graveolens]
MAESYEAIEQLKKYITQALLLAKPSPKYIFYLYLAASDQASLDKVETLLSGPQNRSPDGPTLKQHFDSTKESEMLIKWAIEVVKFDIKYKSQTTIKAETLIDFMVECTINDEESGGNTKASKLLKGKSITKNTKTGHYHISAEGEAKIRERDQVFKTSPEFEKYKNFWIPVSERVNGWTIVTRERTNGGRNEKFHHHPSLTRQLRSKKQVYSFIRYGFVTRHNEGLSSLEAAENLVPEPKRQRRKTPKEAVEEFLAEARNNLNNYRG